MAEEQLITKKATRISFLRVPLDIVSEEDLDPIIRAFFDSAERKQIMLLSLWDLLKARHNAEYRAMIASAALVIPISKSIIGGVKFLHKELPFRWMPFEFIIKLLGVLEHYGRSVYLLGSPKKHLQKAELNLRQTFPGLRIVGRYCGYYQRGMETDILKAIYKASPTLLLVARGVPGRERWINRNSKHVQPGMYLWCSDSFDIFAHKRKRVSKKTFSHGMEWLHYTLRSPWKLIRLFPYLYYKLLVLVYRIKK